LRACSNIDVNYISHEDLWRFFIKAIFIENFAECFHRYFFVTMEFV
jgi:hypothetical protein